MTQKTSHKSSDKASLAEATVSFDIVVVGGGMVGATAALGMAQQGFKVALIEKTLPQMEWSNEAEFETRVSALTRASENIFKALGVWQGIENRRCHAFTDMHVWEDTSTAQVHFSAADIQENNLGYVVENKVIQLALWEQILKQSNIAVMTDEVLEGLNIDLNHAEIVFQSGLVLKAQLIVGADGAFSKIRQLANIGLTTHDYEQCAIVGCVETEQSPLNTCWQRYREEGPFAYLAMSQNLSSIAWYMPLAKMDWALSLSDDAFAEAVTRASGECLGKVVRVYKRDGFPLVRRHALEYVKPHIALVGDAAHTIHPQAGQGVNLGLLDAAALIETLTLAKADNKEWSRHSVLRRYERWRKGDNEIVQRSMEGFDWLFKQDSMFKNQARKTLLPIANQAHPIKNWLMNQALNGRYALPELAQTP